MQTSQAVSDYFKTIEEYPKETFFTLLQTSDVHPAANHILTAFTGTGAEKTITHTVCKNSADLLAAMNGQDADAWYITLNQFAGKCRRSSSCYAISGFYIDLDMHEGSQEEIDNAIGHTMSRLNQLWTNGQLLAPTMVTATGRGLGVFYLLSRTISCKGNTKGLQKYYDFLYECLLRAYHLLLDEAGLLSVDMCVKDRARICRIPGSYNKKADRPCLLFDTPHPYYTMDEIKEGCHLQQYTCRTSDVRPVFFPADKHHFLGRRIQALQQVCALKEQQKIYQGWRNELCFQLYNALVQTTDQRTARKTVQSFNASFAIPLPESALRASFHSVDSHRDAEGVYQGYYRFATATIKRRLRLSDKDAQAIGLGLESRRLLRQQKKDATKAARSKRQQLILSCKKANPDMTRAELLKTVNAQLDKPISLRTLDRVLAAFCKDDTDMDSKNTADCQVTGTYNKTNKTAQNDVKATSTCVAFTSQDISYPDKGPSTLFRAHNKTINTAKNCHSTLFCCKYIDTKEQTNAKAYALSFLAYVRENHKEHTGVLRMLAAFEQTLQEAADETGYLLCANLANAYSHSISICDIELLLCDLDGIYRYVKQGKKQLTLFGKRRSFAASTVLLPDGFTEHFIWSMPKSEKKQNAKQNLQTERMNPEQYRIYREYENRERFRDFAARQSDMGTCMRQIEQAIETITDRKLRASYRQSLRAFYSLTKAQWKALLSRMQDALSVCMDASQVMRVYTQTVCTYFYVTSLAQFVPVRRKRSEAQKQAWENYRQGKSFV